jgi:uncharacterized protein YggE
MIWLLAILLTPLMSLAQAPTTRPEHHPHPHGTLTVTGTGEVSAKPDRAVVRLGVQAQGKDAASVQNEINQKMGAILKSEKDLGIDDKQIQTANLSLNPIIRNRSTSNGEDREEYISGYEGAQTVRIQLDDPSKIGPAVDAGIKAGANRLDGVSFELKNDTDARNAALAAAIGQAKSKAAAMASALDVQLNGIDEVTEGGAEIIPPRPLMRAMAVSAAAPTPVEPGQMNVNASVTVRYRISPAK